MSQRRAEIQALIVQHQVVIVCGETGSGKTTQLPKMCLELGRGLSNRAIVHTQPRRLAATSTAKRIAQELQTELGQWVGYKIRFQDTSSGKTNGPGGIKLVTDGILLAESQGDPLFKAYDTIIIDEAHERSLNIDFLLGYLKQILPKRPDLKLIVTSATIDSERFAKHFSDASGNPAPVIEVSGRLYPVEVRYRDPLEIQKARASNKSDKSGKPAEKKGQLTPSAEVDDELFLETALNAVDELRALGSGDILFFLPGEREIREAANYLRKHTGTDLEILPLYARLSAADQDRIFRTSGKRRVVLATNVAETSLTVPGIHYVIDSGLARVKRYSYRNKVEQLQIERVSKASASQRAGRCGRVASGVCIRLYSEEDFLARPDFTDPEILRSSLASVILRMKSLRLAEVEEFPFLQRPMGRAIADGYQLLSELNALDEGGRLTATGHSLARLPVDPKLARMMVEAGKLGCLREILIITSALSIQDPRDRPHDAQQAADLAHKKFEDEQSDFMTLLKIWNWYQKAKEERESQKDLRNKLSSRFLNANRMREWSEVHTQLLSMAREQGWTLHSDWASSDVIHLALLSGLLGSIGCRHEKEPVYLGARGIKFAIHPSSGLHKKAGKWIVAAEIVETTRLYGRCIARIEPEWVEKMGQHLIKRSHADPHWEKNSGQAVAFETGSIYGLPVYSRRRVSLSNFNRKDARTLLITEGLVPGEMKTQAEFYRHNCKLIQEIEKLEHKARRQDILVDESLIAEFYDQHIPADVFNQKTLERWVRTAPKDTLEKLKLTKEDLLNRQAGGISTDFYPKEVLHGGLSFKLAYHFEPGSPRDGVTLEVPLMFLNQVNPVRCEWLVLGILKEKATLLLKSLPQKLRRHCVPVPQFAEKFTEAHSDMRLWDKPLIEALRNFVVEHTPARPGLSDFRIEGLPSHLFMNFKLIDQHGSQLDMQRSLPTLKAQWGRQAQEQFRQSAEILQAQAEVQSAEGGSAVMHPKVGLASGSVGQGKGVQSQRVTGQSQNSPTGGYQNAARPGVNTQQISPNQSSLGGDQKIVSWSFGELPELLEIKRGNQLIYGYPALKDCGDHCLLEVFDEEHLAKQIHQQGLIRLFEITLKESIKYLKKNLFEFQKIAMLYMPIGSADDLRDQWIQLSILRGALSGPWPVNEESFLKAAEQAKARLNLIAQEIGRTLLSSLNEFSLLSKKIQAVSKFFPDAAEDVANQMRWLFPDNFLLKRPWDQLQHYPRYVKAALVRLDRIRNDPSRDLQNMREIHRLQLRWVKAIAQLKGHEDESLEQFAWQLQELRVSLFAQELKTPMPVSIKRLDKTWEAIERRYR